MVVGGNVTKNATNLSLDSYNAYDTDDDLLEPLEPIEFMEQVRLFFPETFHAIEVFLYNIPFQTLIAIGVSVIIYLILTILSVLIANRIFFAAEYYAKVCYVLRNNNEVDMFKKMKLKFLKD